MIDIPKPQNFQARLFDKRLAVFFHPIWGGRNNEDKKGAAGVSACGLMMTRAFDAIEKTFSECAVILDMVKIK